MNTQKKTGILKFGLMFVLLCIMSLPQFAAAAAPVSQVPTGPKDINGNWATPDYYSTANWANSPPLAKFVDKLPGLGSTKANSLGQFLSVGKPDTITYPGTDYYEIELRQYNERMHSDLPAPGTLLRGYVQVNNGTGPGGVNNLAPDPIHYLGPIIVAQRDRPVRLKFTNKLPIGAAGNLFIPVDTTVMGAGFGPAKGTATRGVGTPCDNTNLDVTTNGYPVSIAGCASYTQNRADIHLHGGRTPWISDGTPHQWITPAGEITPFAKGVSLVNVPDMPNPGDGSATYYFTNQQSARLMFYHDHAFGITRLNVYAGEAAGYLITDPYEKDLVDRGIIPADNIPLILQDKTFVDASEIRKYDPLWNWGSGPVDGNGIRTPVEGDLWMPHVYMPAQSSIAGTGGVNPFGRWMYGPWFFPATVITAGPKANPYYDPDCSSNNPFILANCQTPGQPTQIPGTPNLSMGMEAFQDSVVVNGTAFPSLTVDPRAYRFRILNAASDRFQNLSFYIADTGNLPDGTPNYSPDARLTAVGKSKYTEIKAVTASAELAAAAAAAGNPWPEFWPIDGRDGGVPDPATQGPSFIQIGTEGGFLPKPVVINPQPITYVTDPTAFWVGNVDKMALALGPAERADVIVDFTPFAGKTLILYNDAPAAWPARVPGYDYFTGAPDMRDSGGYGAGGVFNPATGVFEAAGANVPHGILPGYAPNTRTVLQVIVTGSVGTADTPPTHTFDPAKLEAEFTGPAAAPSPYTASGTTLFERAQEPIIVGQAAYKDAYPHSYFPTNFPWEGIAQMNDDFLQFVTLKGEEVTVFNEKKGIHDEMGASFDPVYGRMSGNLGMQNPNPTTLTANLILYGFSDLPTETINNSISADVQVNAATKTLSDGTQIWKINHNGVDTHPIHFHIFDVQLINRVGWDGQILMPEPNELGWKDTVKISPLEDTIVAVRPRAPAMPFGIPNSIRPLNPAIPIGSAMGFNSIDPLTGQAYVDPSPYAAGVTNILYNFGWEYVWHCHILSHEEMDMMRPIVLNYVAALPLPFNPTVPSSGTTRVISWVDPTPINPVNGVPANPETYRNAANEIGYNVYRSTSASFPINPATGKPTPLNGTSPILANSTSYSTTAASLTTSYRYIVEAFNAAGSTVAYIGSSPFTVAVTASAPPTGGYVSPASITLTATVNNKPTEATISRVEFYDGATLLGSDTSSPYTRSWTGVSKGTHIITAKVIHNFPGGSIVSAPLSIVVGGTLTADFTPAEASSFGVCSSVVPATANAITFTSTSTATSGTISTVFKWTLDGVVLPSTANTFTMALPSVGTHQMTLLVKKSGAGTVETAQVTKSFTVTNNAPVANAHGPYSVVPGGSLTLNGTGTDVDVCDGAGLTYAWNVDNIGNYDFFTANPTISYNTLMTVLGAGTHTMTLKVTDSHGAVGTATAELTLTVGAPVSITVPATNSTGSYTVSWGASLTSGVTYVLEESTVADFSAVTNPAFSGLSASITGKVDGTYYYRVKAVHTASGVSSAWVGGQVVVLLPPVAPTLTTPVGTIITATPAYTFNAVPGATGYQVYLYDYSSASGNVTVWYTPAAAGCPANTGTCSIPQTTALANGVSYDWFARAQNASGDGPFSTSNRIRIQLPIPSAPTLVTPIGTITTTTPAYTFNAVPGATGYQVYLYDYSVASGNVTVWYTPAAAGCPTNAGTCSIPQTTALVSGVTYDWFARAQNLSGDGPFSTNNQFNVQ